MSFTQSIRTCFRKYVTFSGRASRPEYWFFFLFVFLGGMIATALDMAVFPDSVEVNEEVSDTEVAFEVNATGPIQTVFSLGTFLPLLAAGWRRMHDSGRSGLHLVYPLMVMIGTATFAAFGMGIAEGVGGAGEGVATVTAIILMIALAVLLISPLLVLWWLARPTQEGANRYGPQPHMVEA
ncbi:DUF805 domain-containing protein [Tropicimonas sp. S265A]|uniref:DUF805 domain-containing protein n=1 Tax=Tropicimonas sp. S265A TaxID=3415134 RepID=UPI003C7CFB9B